MRGNFVTDRRGVNNPNYLDGRKNTRLYSIYYNMITRCYNKNTSNYHHYGGRGIRVNEDWCELYNINYGTVRDRLKRGWSYEKALLTQVDTRFRRKKVV